MKQEQAITGAPGGVMLAVLLFGAAAGIAGVVVTATAGAGPLVVACFLFIKYSTSFASRDSRWSTRNQARVVTLFGVYKGSMKTPGIWWVNPFSVRRNISLRFRNFESS